MLLETILVPIKSMAAINNIENIVFDNFVRKKSLCLTAE